MSAPRSSAVLTGLVAIGLLAVSFLTWFSSDGGGEGGASLDMWEAFSVIDVVVAVTVATAVGTAVAALLAYESGLPVAGSALTAPLALAALVLVAVRIADPPGSDLGRGVGAWLGLAALAAIVLGALAGLREERASRLTDR